MYYTVNPDGITFHGVSNMNASSITKAKRECKKLLKTIGKVIEDDFGGTETTVTFYIDLTDEEIEQLENGKYKITQ